MSMFSCVWFSGKTRPSPTLSTRTASTGHTTTSRMYFLLYLSSCAWLDTSPHLICTSQQTFYIGSMSGRYTFLHQADISSHVGPISDVQHGCISNNHIGPMSIRLAFPHRTDIAFLPRSDISRRHFTDVLMSAQYRMCNTARCRTDVVCISNKHIGPMSSRLAFPYLPTSAFDLGWIAVVDTLPTFPNPPLNPCCQSKTYMVINKRNHKTADSIKILLI